MWCLYQVVDAGAVVLLVLCVQEPELSLKRVAASALSDIAKHTPELAQAVVDAGLFCHPTPPHGCIILQMTALGHKATCCKLTPLSVHLEHCSPGNGHALVQGCSTRVH